MIDDKKYWHDQMESCRADLRRYNLQLEEAFPTDEEINNALCHHLSQLERLGATLEDDVCEVLRKIQLVSDIRHKIEARAAVLKEYTSEYWNASGE